MESTLAVKQRFGIIGDNPILNRAIEKSIQVASSDISVSVSYTHLTLPTILLV